MKRNWLMGLVMAGMLALAGCGGQGTTSSTAPSTNETITVSAAASMQGALEELKADYVKKHNLKPEQYEIRGIKSDGTYDIFYIVTCN